MVIERKLNYVALVKGSIEENLKAYGFSSSVCKALKREFGLAALNGVPKFLSATADIGDTICVIIMEKAPYVLPFDAPLTIIYEDEDLAIIDKPAGMAVLPRHGDYGKSLMNALAARWGDFVYHPVNRLDRGTSGAMAVAKHALAHGILSRQIADGEFVRTYLAYAVGTTKANGIIDAPIGMPYPDSMKRGICSEGQAARTHFERIAANNDFSVVRLTLDTGRTHQIRVHAAHIGHPLVGDTLYGAPPDARLSRPALHSETVRFLHPITKAALNFSAPFPKDMLAFAASEKL